MKADHSRDAFAHKCQWENSSKWRTGEEEAATDGDRSSVSRHVSVSAAPIQQCRVMLQRIKVRKGTVKVSRFLEKQWSIEKQRARSESKEYMVVIDTDADDVHTMSEPEKNRASKTDDDSSGDIKPAKKRQESYHKRLDNAFCKTGKRGKRKSSDTSRLLTTLDPLHQATISNLRKNSYSELAPDDEHVSVYSDVMFKLSLYSPPASDAGDMTPPQAMSPTRTDCPDISVVQEEWPRVTRHVWVENEIPGSTDAAGNEVSGSSSAGSPADVQPSPSSSSHSGSPRSAERRAAYAVREAVVKILPTTDAKRIPTLCSPEKSSPPVSATRTDAIPATSQHELLDMPSNKSPASQRVPSEFWNQTGLGTPETLGPRSVSTVSSLAAEVLEFQTQHHQEPAGETSSELQQNAELETVATSNEMEHQEMAGVQDQSVAPEFARFCEETSESANTQEGNREMCDELTSELVTERKQGSAESCAVEMGQEIAPERTNFMDKMLPDVIEASRFSCVNPSENIEDTAGQAEHHKEPCTLEMHIELERQEAEIDGAEEAVMTSEYDQVRETLAEEVLMQEEVVMNMTTEHAEQMQRQPENVESLTELETMNPNLDEIQEPGLQVELRTEEVVTDNVIGETGGVCKMSQLNCEMGVAALSEEPLDTHEREERQQSESREQYQQRHKGNGTDTAAKGEQNSDRKQAKHSQRSKHNREREKSKDRNDKEKRSSKTKSKHDEKTKHEEKKVKEKSVDKEKTRGSKVEKNKDKPKKHHGHKSERTANKNETTEKDGDKAQDTTEKSGEQQRDSHKDRSKSKERSKSVDGSHKDRSKSKERSKSVDGSSHREQSKSKDRSKGKEKSSSKERTKSLERSKSKERSKSTDLERSKSKERSKSTERSKNKEQERKEKERGKKRDSNSENKSAVKDKQKKEKDEETKPTEKSQTTDSTGVKEKQEKQKKDQKERHRDKGNQRHHHEKEKEKKDKPQDTQKVKRPGGEKQEHKVKSSEKLKSSERSHKNNHHKSKNDKHRSKSISSSSKSKTQEVKALQPQVQSSKDEEASPQGRVPSPIHSPSDEEKEMPTKVTEESQKTLETIEKAAAPDVPVKKRRGRPPKRKPTDKAPTLKPSQTKAPHVSVSVTDKAANVEAESRAQVERQKSLVEDLIGFVSDDSSEDDDQHVSSKRIKSPVHSPEDSPRAKHIAGSKQVKSLRSLTADDESTEGEATEEEVEPAPPPCEPERRDVVRAVDETSQPSAPTRRLPLDITNTKRMDEKPRRLELNPVKEMRTKENIAVIKPFDPVSVAQENIQVFMVAGGGGNKDLNDNTDKRSLGRQLSEKEKKILSKITESDSDVEMDEDKLGAAQKDRTNKPKGKKPDSAETHANENDSEEENEEEEEDVCERVDAPPSSPSPRAKLIPSSRPSNGSAELMAVDENQDADNEESEEEEEAEKENERIVERMEAPPRSPTPPRALGAGLGGKATTSTSTLNGKQGQSSDEGSDEDSSRHNKAMSPPRSPSPPIEDIKSPDLKQDGLFPTEPAASQFDDNRETERHVKSASPIRSPSPQIEQRRRMLHVVSELSFADKRKAIDGDKAESPERSEEDLTKSERATQITGNYTKSKEEIQPSDDASSDEERGKSMSRSRVMSPPRSPSPVRAEKPSGAQETTQKQDSSDDESEEEVVHATPVKMASPPRSPSLVRTGGETDEKQDLEESEEDVDETLVPRVSSPPRSPSPVGSPDAVKSADSKQDSSRETMSNHPSNIEAERCPEESEGEEEEEDEEMIKASKLSSPPRSPSPQRQTVEDINRKEEGEKSSEESSDDEEDRPTARRKAASPPPSPSPVKSPEPCVPASEVQRGSRPSGAGNHEDSSGDEEEEDMRKERLRMTSPPKSPSPLRSFLPDEPVVQCTETETPEVVPPPAPGRTANVTSDEQLTENVLEFEGQVTGVCETVVTTDGAEAGDVVGDVVSDGAVVGDSLHTGVSLGDEPQQGMDQPSAAQVVLEEVMLEVPVVDEIVAATTGDALASSTSFSVAQSTSDHISETTAVSDLVSESWGKLHEEETCTIHSEPSVVEQAKSVEQTSEQLGASEIETPEEEPRQGAIPPLDAEEKEQAEGSSGESEDESAVKEVMSPPRSPSPARATEAERKDDAESSDEEEEESRLSRKRKMMSPPRSPSPTKSPRARVAVSAEPERGSGDQSDMTDAEEQKTKRVRLNSPPRSPSPARTAELAANEPERETKENDQAAETREIHKESDEESEEDDPVQKVQVMSPPGSPDTEDVKVEMAKKEESSGDEESDEEEPTGREMRMASPPRSPSPGIPDDIHSSGAAKDQKPEAGESNVEDSSEDEEETSRMRTTLMSPPRSPSPVRHAPADVEESANTQRGEAGDTMVKTVKRKLEAHENSSEDESEDEGVRTKVVRLDSPPGSPPAEQFSTIAPEVGLDLSLKPRSHSRPTGTMGAVVSAEESESENERPASPASIRSPTPPPIMSPDYESTAMDLSVKPQERPAVPLLHPVPEYTDGPRDQRDDQQQHNHHCDAPGDQALVLIQDDCNLLPPDLDEDEMADVGETDFSGHYNPSEEVPGVIDLAMTRRGKKASRQSSPEKAAGDGGGGGASEPGDTQRGSDGREKAPSGGGPPAPTPPSPPGRGASTRPLVLTPAQPPPTRDSVAADSVALGLTEEMHQDAFFSNPADVPIRPR